MRGALDDDGSFGQFWRIIPAYAGAQFWIYCVAPVQGIIPAYAGAPTQMATCPTLTRIIPAYAGSTDTPFFVRFSARDHPRVCGEHQIRSLPALWPGGSSPRMRGALPFPGILCRKVRIIPAYAGSTSGMPGRSTPRWDHPRVCGEHRGHQNRKFWRVGSSPRMRGAPGCGALP